MKHTFRFGEVLRRLGVTGADQVDPVINDDVQPVFLFGDARDQVPRIVAPTLAMGGHSNQVPNNAAFVEIQAAPGGSYIEFLQAYPLDPSFLLGFESFLETELLAAPLTGMGFGAVQSNQWQLGPEPALTRVRYGHMIAANFPPAMNAGAAFEYGQPAYADALLASHPWRYVPPNQFLSIAIWTYSATLAVAWETHLALIVRDLPALIPR